MKKLVIGTANFSQEYKGVYVGEGNAYKIIRHCIDNGIDTFDSAEAYNNFNWINANFDLNIQYKCDVIPNGKAPKNTILIKHHPGYYSNLNEYNGFSVYDPDYVYTLEIAHRHGAKLIDNSIIQTPLIKVDTLKQLKACGYHIQCRNVIGLFLSPKFKEILKGMWFVDSFVVGVDNLDQTKQLIDIFQEANK